MHEKEHTIECEVQFLVIADNPIRRLEEDTLGRAPAARSFAEQILSLDASEGMVVGVLGPWGSGKTSFINLARCYLKEAGLAVLDFNPWMFSGTEQLLNHFFSELTTKLKLRMGLSDVARLVEEYAAAFSGMTQFPWIDLVVRGAKVFSKILGNRESDLDTRRKRVENALASLGKPIIVVMDDIDRLTTEEIREVFRLVRLIANFPNIIYVLAFDRLMVEKALEEPGISGRDYLEKILQLVVDLPAVSPEILHRQLLQAINEALSGIDDPGPFYESEWPDIFMEIIRPLVRNMRDVRRFATTIRGTIKSLNGQIALTDILALEAIRLFLPDVFAQLPFAVEALTTVSDSISRREDHFKDVIDTLINTNKTHSAVVRSMIRRLFPAARQHIENYVYGPDWKNKWLRERRVAHKDILRLYLERVAGEGLQNFTDAERAFSVMADRKLFETYLRSLDPQRLEDVIASLEVFEDRFSEEHVVPGTIVLLNLRPELPERPRGLFDLDARLVVGRVVYRLLRSLNDPVAVENAVRAIWPELTSLSAKLQLIEKVGYWQGVGHKLVSEAAAAEFERIWRSEVRTAPATELKREIDLLRVLFIAKRYAEPDEPALEIPDMPELTLAILRAARTEVRSMTTGSRAIRRSLRLQWDALIELFGDEECLRERVNRLKASLREGSLSDEDAELLRLVDKYLEGWRPDEFDEFPD